MKTDPRMIGYPEKALYSIVANGNRPSRIRKTHARPQI